MLFSQRLSWTNRCIDQIARLTDNPGQARRGVYSIEGLSAILEMELRHTAIYQVLHIFFILSNDSIDELIFYCMTL